MVRTFAARLHPNWAGWSPCGVQAARLRLPETIDVIMGHAQRHQKYPYGGWNSVASRMKGSQTGATDTPYFDTAGVNMAALQEALLQSHAMSGPDGVPLLTGGPIRVLPAVRPDWSGRFRLLARGGFLIDVEFANARATSVRIVSQRGQLLRLINPFEQCQLNRNGKSFAKSADRILSYETKSGDVLEFRDAAR